MAFGNPGHAVGRGVAGEPQDGPPIFGTHCAVRAEPFAAVGDIPDEPPPEHAAIAADAAIKSATYCNFTIVHRCKKRMRRLKASVEVTLVYQFCTVNEATEWTHAGRLMDAKKYATSQSFWRLRP